MWLSKLIRPDGIVLLESASKEEAIRELVDSIDMRSYSIGKDEIVRRLLAREELMSTGIGLGIGVPHIRAAGVGEPVLRLGIRSSGIEGYESMDGKPVNLLFMIILKEDQQREHVSLLAEIVRMMKNDQLRSSLLAVKSKEVAWSLLQANLENPHASA